MNLALLENILTYLNTNANYQWATSRTLIKKLNIPDLNALELDAQLVQYYQNTDKPLLRFSTLPSKINLDVLWTVR